MTLSRMAGATAAFLLAAGNASAMLVDVSLFEDGPIVRLEYSGTVDLTGFNFSGTATPFSNSAFIRPGLESPGFYEYQNGFTVSKAGETRDSYYSLMSSGPQNFGTPGSVFDTMPAVFGDSFFFLFLKQSDLAAPHVQIELPQGYASNTPLDGRAELSGTDLATIGADPGVYEWMFGNNTLRLTVSAASDVPLPASVLLLLGGLGALGAVRAARAPRRG
ncbi:hypothetical protein LNKW23_03440 [Paralimibaculum aggregatum]|uniref:Secreted protein n=1 Tax=Paralimibaculum aggregatum TaxID=3036245 RepID=A0ABQ6LDW6_9RHOB|nr:VPLPA-CTERM sorting domain-containing protein [Limibaculum sp. NKW23]GMG81132.1 hypothetical protein LNKW23_03440 [Limibaculum sp. NKW23]